MSQIGIKHRYMTRNMGPPRYLASFCDTTAKSLIIPSASDSPVHDHMEPAPVYETAERVSQYDPTAPQYNPTSPMYLHSTSPKYSPTTPEPSVCDTPRCDHALEDAPASLEQAVRSAFTSMTSTKVILSPHYCLRYVSFSIEQSTSYNHTIPARCTVAGDGHHPCRAQESTP